MSTAVIPGTLQHAGDPQGLPFLVPSRASAKPATPRYVRRRGSLIQGQALETLGHAVEYLVDNGLFHRSSVDTRANQEAVQILMRLSRSVFAECPEVIPMRRRFAQWFLQLASRARRKNAAPAC